MQLSNSLLLLAVSVTLRHHALSCRKKWERYECTPPFHTPLCNEVRGGNPKRYAVSCNVNFLFDFSHSARITLQYLLVDMCIDLARISSSAAILFDMLIPMVLVPLPIAFVAIFLASFLGWLTAGDPANYRISRTIRFLDPLRTILESRASPVDLDRIFDTVPRLTPHSWATLLILMSEP